MSHKLMIGGSQVSKLYLGSTPVLKVYLGESLIYPMGTRADGGEEWETDYGIATIGDSPTSKTNAEFKANSGGSAKYSVTVKLYQYDKRTLTAYNASDTVRCRVHTVTDSITLTGTFTTKNIGDSEKSQDVTKAYSSTEYKVPSTLLTGKIYLNYGHTITFDSVGGSTVSSIDVAHNGTLSLPTSPTKSNNEFLGWYTSSSYTTQFITTTKITSNITLYAKWLVTGKDGWYNVSNVSAGAITITAANGGTSFPAGINSGATSEIITRIISNSQSASMGTLVYRTYDAEGNPSDHTPTGPVYTWRSTNSLFILNSSSGESVSISVASRGTSEGAERETTVYRKATFSYNGINYDLETQVTLSQDKNVKSEALDELVYNTPSPLKKESGSITRDGGSETYSSSVTNSQKWHYHYTSGANGPAETPKSVLGSITWKKGNCVPSDRFSVSTSNGRGILTHTSMTTNVGLDTGIIIAANSGDPTKTALATVQVTNSIRLEETQKDSNNVSGKNKYKTPLITYKDPDFSVTYTYKLNDNVTTTGKISAHGGTASPNISNAKITRTIITEGALATRQKYTYETRDANNNYYVGYSEWKASDNYEILSSESTSLTGTNALNECTFTYALDSSTPAITASPKFYMSNSYGELIGDNLKQETLAERSLKVNVTMTATNYSSCKITKSVIIKQEANSYMTLSPVEIPTDVMATSEIKEIAEVYSVNKDGEKEFSFAPANDISYLRVTAKIERHELWTSGYYHHSWYYPYINSSLRFTVSPSTAANVSTSYDSTMKGYKINLPTMTSTTKDNVFTVTATYDKLSKTSLDITLRHLQNTTAGLDLEYPNNPLDSVVLYASLGSTLNAYLSEVCEEGEYEEEDWQYWYTPHRSSLCLRVYLVNHSSSSITLNKNDFRIEGLDMDDSMTPTYMYTAGYGGFGDGTNSNSISIAGNNTYRQIDLYFENAVNYSGARTYLELSLFMKNVLLVNGVLRVIYSETPKIQN